MEYKYDEIKKCRLCKTESLQDILSLGDLSYTGRFIEKDESDPPIARLAIVRCTNCGLVQLKDIYPESEMYGTSYGYRSSITETMRNHLHKISEYAYKKINGNDNYSILDIGSNDGTLLNYFKENNVNLVGIDPCASKHKDNYPQNTIIVNDYFSRQKLLENGAPIKFDIITSIAMFYDLNDPIVFAENIFSVLNDNGIWITEQTHSHTLIDSNAYDSICHEHATYLSLRAMENICKKAKLKILDISTNNINGGSFTVLISKINSTYQTNEHSLSLFQDKESRLSLNNERVWKNFKNRVYNHKKELQELLDKFKNEGKTVLGYGASTKGNVLLQYCNISTEVMPFILERDPEKYGKYTPKTNIPIISEEEGRKMKPDILIVFPWHFKEEIIKREKEFLLNGGTLLFPLPEIKLITDKDIK